MAREDLVRRLVKSLDPSATSLALGDGWPSLIQVETSRGATAVAVHAGTVSSHSRKPYERRVQAPASGKAIASPGGALPLYVAAVRHGGRSLLFVSDASHRVGITARSGPLFRVGLLDKAASTGWAVEAVASGQVYYAIYPGLFPALVDVLSSDLSIDSESIRTIADSSGYLEGNNQEAATRARRLALSYVRDRRFSVAVRKAYHYRCAMCQIDLGLVAGAHIFPVSAVNSPDKVWNGLALCHNHHGAFDAHDIWIGQDFKVEVSPRLVALAITNQQSKVFLETTRGELWVPGSVSEQPRPTMLARRYSFYGDKYAWAPNF